MQTVTSETAINPKVLGAHIREARESAGLSRAKLSKHTGIPHKAIEKFEYGTQEPSASRLVVLCRALELPIQELVGMDGENFPAPSAERPVRTVQESAEPQPVAMPEVDPIDQVGRILDQLDTMRVGDFEGVVRRPLALAEDAARLLCNLEPDELVTTARERDLFRKALPTAREAEDGFEEKADQAEAQCVEIGNRIVDTAILGRDLFEIDLSALHKLADRLASERNLEEPPLFSGWGEHAVLVPKIRPILRQLAVTGRGPDLANEGKFPNR